MESLADNASAWTRREILHVVTLSLHFSAFYNWSVCGGEGGESGNGIFFFGWVGEGGFLIVQPKQVWSFLRVEE